MPARLLKAGSSGSPFFVAWYFHALDINATGMFFSLSFSAWKQEAEAESRQCTDVRMHT